jgi:hypothetical protein
VGVLPPHAHHLQHVPAPRAGVSRRQLAAGFYLHGCGSTATALAQVCRCDSKGPPQPYQQAVLLYVVSLYCYICVLRLLCMCPHTEIYASSCCCMCVLILLYMCPHMLSLRALPDLTKQAVSRALFQRGRALQGQGVGGRSQERLHRASRGAGVDGRGHKRRGLKATSLFASY